MRPDVAVQIWLGGFEFNYAHMRRWHRCNIVLQLTVVHLSRVHHSDWGLLERSAREEFVKVQNKRTYTLRSPAREFVQMSHTMMQIP